MKKLNFIYIGLVLLLPLLSFAIDSDDLLNSLSPTGLVNDYAAVFTTNELQELEQHLQATKEQTGAEIAVVTLPSLKDGAISDFANLLYKKWGIGKKGKDNGVLILTAINDKKVRIEVGYGLEGLFPDRKTGQIIDEEIIPSFKEGKYADGLTFAAISISEQIVADQANPEGDETKAPDTEEKKGGSGGLIVFVVFIIIIIVFVMVAKKSGGNKDSSQIAAPPSDDLDAPEVDAEEDDDEDDASDEEEEKPPVFGGGESGGGGAERGW